MELQCKQNNQQPRTPSLLLHPRALNPSVYWTLGAPRLSFYDFWVFFLDTLLTKHPSIQTFSKQGRQNNLRDPVPPLLLQLPSQVVDVSPLIAFLWPRVLPDHPEITICSAGQRSPDFQLPHHFGRRIGLTTTPGYFYFILLQFFFLFPSFLE